MRTATRAALLAGLGSLAGIATAAPIQYGFLWHMHQPNYYPYESITQIQANNRFGFDVVGVHNNRFGPYTTWPRNAVQAGHNAGLQHLGAQVSFTGALIENLNVLRDAGVGGGMWNNWSAGYFDAISLQTGLGNSRLDLVAFGYHHPLAPLLDRRDLIMQVRLHKHLYNQTWNGLPYSKGMFPAENAFSIRMIPALVSEGLDWVMVDNIHFDRACVNYPHTNASNLFAPNRADQLNPDPAANGGAWVQLNNVWAPSRVSAPFGYQPHRVQYVDPNTGAVSKIVAIPTARYEGNEDGRGGYGALQYESVMSQYLSYNTDASRPMFVVLHHDGDNYGGGTDSYYHSNFQNMVSWDVGAANYECTTVADYLERFPVPADSVIHVEDGSWAGADNGDPEFRKWLGDPDSSGWSPDRNSWAVMTAARNRVYHADDTAPHTGMAGILSGNGTLTEKAWHFLLCGQASDYWYWDNSGEPWDSNVTRACNQAVTFADQVISANPNTDTTAPAVFIPQREPYNPGALEWGNTPQPSDFEVWTYAYDVNGLGSITLKWRTDKDGANPLGSVENETYAGGPEVNAWQSVSMTERPDPPIPAAANILPATYRAKQFYGMITGQKNVLVDYYVEAVDTKGNTHRSDIFHVWVGDGGGSGTARVTTSPETLSAGQPVEIRYIAAGGPLTGATAINLYWGINNWTGVTTTPMTWDAGDARWEVTVTVPVGATRFDCVFNNGLGAWDNNNSANWQFTVAAGPSPTPTGTPLPTGTPGGTPSPSPTASPTSIPVLPNPFAMDGTLDSGTCALTGGLRVAERDGWIYVGADVAGQGDAFILVSDNVSPLQAAPWAKGGQVGRWKFFLAREGSNNYAAWFNAAGASVTDAANLAFARTGTVLEGAIRKSSVGTGAVQVALGSYGTNDGGALQAQSPASSDGNASIDATEFVALVTGVDPCSAPTATATPSPTATAAPTATAVPTATATATAGPSPTATPANQPPSAPTFRPVLHAEAAVHAVDPEGGLITYRYSWTSDGANDAGVVPIVHSKRSDAAGYGEDILRHGAEGVTLDVGETWTLTVTPYDAQNAAGTPFTGIFRIGATGVVFEGWLVR